MSKVCIQRQAHGSNKPIWPDPLDEGETREDLLLSRSGLVDVLVRSRKALAEALATAEMAFLEGERLDREARDARDRERRVCVDLERQNLRWAKLAEALASELAKATVDADRRDRVADLVEQLGSGRLAPSYLEEELDELLESSADLLEVSILEILELNEICGSCDRECPTPVRRLAKLYGDIYERRGRMPEDAEHAVSFPMWAIEPSWKQGGGDDHGQGCVD